MGELKGSVSPCGCHKCRWHSFGTGDSRVAGRAPRRSLASSGGVTVARGATMKCTSCKNLHLRDHALQINEIVFVFNHQKVIRQIIGVLELQWEGIPDFGVPHILASRPREG